MLFGTTTVLIQQKLLSRPVGYLVQGGMFDALSIVSLIRWEEAVEKLFSFPSAHSYIMPCMVVQGCT